MHGGAAGSGAREDNRNALKHGRYTAEALESRRQMRIYSTGRGNSSSR